MVKTDQYHLELLSQKTNEDFYHLIQNNMSRLEDFFAGTVSKTKTLEDTRNYCQEIEQKIQDKTYFPYLIIETETNKTVGLFDVKNMDWEIPKGELGAFIDSNYEGKGIITRCGKLLIDQIVKEHHFKKLFCRVADRNIRSKRVIDQMGFELEGTIRCDYRTTIGELVDLNYYGKVFN